MKIGYVPTLLGHSVPATWDVGIRRDLTYKPYITYTPTDPNNSIPAQIAKVESFISQRYDAIILQALDAAALSPAVGEAQSAGIHVITLNLDTVQKHDAHVTMYSYEAGQLIGQRIITALGGHGTVVILQSPPGATLGEEREQGFRDYAKNYPGITIVAQPANWFKDTAISVMNTLIHSLKRIDAVYGINDSMAEGAAVALAAAGRKNVIVWGADGERDALDMITSGQMTGTIYTNTFDQGTTALRVTELLVSSGVKPSELPNEALVQMPSVVVTKATVNSIPPSARWQ
jgi:ABC-type sugar transport system substrate-binding protein